MRKIASVAPMILLIAAVACEQEGQGTVTEFTNPLPTASSVGVPAAPIPGTTSEISGDFRVAAATIEGFYGRGKRFDCPEGGGSCPLTNGTLNVKCDAGDVATGGGALAFFPANPEFFIGAVMNYPAGTDSWRIRQFQAQEGSAYIVRVICADLTP